MSKVALTELTQTQLIHQTDYLEKLWMIAACIKHEAKFRSLMTSSESVQEGNKPRNQPNTGQTTVTNWDDMGKADSARIWLTLPIVLFIIMWKARRDFIAKTLQLSLEQYI